MERLWAAVQRTEDRQSPYGLRLRQVCVGKAGPLAILAQAILAQAILAQGRLNGAALVAPVGEPPLACGALGSAGEKGQLLEGAQELLKDQSSRG